MVSSIIPEHWRGPIVYALMSVFVTWHALCLIVAPAPTGSAIAKSLRPWVGQYLGVIDLNVGWGFFAPVGMTAEIRYVVIDDSGKKHTFMPTRGLPWYHPSKLWIRDRYRSISSNPEKFGDALIQDFCTKHAALNPTAIELIRVEQTKDFLPQHQLAGKNALDPEFATTTTLRAGSCPSQ